MEALEECAAPRPLDFLTALRRTDWSKNNLLPWLLSHSNSSHETFWTKWTNVWILSGNTNNCISLQFLFKTTAVTTPEKIKMEILVVFQGHDCYWNYRVVLLCLLFSSFFFWNCGLPPAHPLIMTLCLENETNENKLGRLENQVVLNLKKKNNQIRWLRKKWLSFTELTTITTKRLICVNRTLPPPQFFSLISTTNCDLGAIV